MTVLESTLSVENRYRQLFRQRLVILAVIFIAIIASLLLDFTLGPSGLPLHSLIKTLMHPSGATNGMRVIVWDIRLPYALMALLVGMALGLAGAEMQTILNNSLASPFTLGVSSAAAFGAALAIVLGIGIPGVPESGFIPANAFPFALLSALLLDSLTRWTRVPTSGVVLFGIALVFTFNALVSIMQFVADEDTLQGLVFWTMGSLARASWEKLAVLAAAMAIVLPWSLRRAWQLTALRLGEERAMSFGIDVRRLRLGSLLRISLLAALSVAFVGPIGFIGLVAPHISRLLLGEDHRFYLPGSILIGEIERLIIKHAFSINIVLARDASIFARYCLRSGRCDITACKLEGNNFENMLEASYTKLRGCGIVLLVCHSAIQTVYALLCEFICCVGRIQETDCHFHSVSVPGNRQIDVAGDSCAIECQCFVAHLRQSNLGNAEIFRAFFIDSKIDNSCIHVSLPP